MAKANWVEKTVVNNSVWAFIQRSRIVPLWAASIYLPKDSKVLEVGCGRGVGAVILSSAFKPAVFDAFDIDEEMVSKARRYVADMGLGSINVSSGDVTAIDSPDGAYDAVFDFFTLHHVEDWRKGMSEISRVLKPGGFFGFSEVYGGGSGGHFLRNLVHPQSEGIFERSDWVRSLAENNLRMVEKRSNMWGYGIIGVAKRG